ncbi:MAG: hypothetical protein ABL958_01475 [Bdellovibrionia bacterium]
MAGNRESQKENPTDSGFGLVEIVMAIGVLATLVAAIALISKTQRTSSIQLASKTDCTTLTTGITNQIQAYDNSLTVRNFNVLADSNVLGQVMPTTDPFCNTVGGRIAVCDPFLPVSRKEGGLIDLADLRTYLNVRGAFTWTQSVYNANEPAICGGSGIQLTAAQLGAIIPGARMLPNWASHFNLIIKPRGGGINCGDQSTSPKTTFDIQVSTSYKTTNTADANFESCATNLTIAAPIDSVKPKLTIPQVVNGLGAPVPNGTCTDRRTIETIDWDFAGDPGTAWQDVHFNYGYNEPGSVLLSRKDATWDSNDPGEYYNVPDIRLPAGQATITPPLGTISYNQKVAGAISFRGQADRGGIDQFPNSMYRFNFAVVDTSGNVSDPNTDPTQTTTRSYMVHSPTCLVDPSVYCPDASPATSSNPACVGGCATGGVPDPNCTECWQTGGDKNIRPYDICMNGECRQGTRRAQGCNDPMSYCQGTLYPDDCGQMACPGGRPPSCPNPVDTSTYYCGEFVPGDCTSNCGIGTLPDPRNKDITAYDCNCPVMDPNCIPPNGDTQLRGVGGTNGAILCPPPPPATLGQHQAGCGCTGIDYSTIPCGTAVSDICVAPATAANVTPESCGLGTQGCSPCAPTPTLAPSVCNEAPTSGFWICKDHQRIGDTYCQMPQNPTLITPNPTCAVYTLTARVTGHRHGGSSLRYRMSFEGRPFSVWIFRGVQYIGGFNLARSNDCIGPDTNGHGDQYPPFNPLPQFTRTYWTRAGMQSQDCGFPDQTMSMRATPGVPVNVFGTIYDIHDSSMRVDWTVTPSSP